MLKAKVGHTPSRGQAESNTLIDRKNEIRSSQVQVDESGATTVGTGETGPPTFRLADQQCIGPPNFWP